MRLYVCIFLFFVGTLAASAERVSRVSVAEFSTSSVHLNWQSDSEVDGATYTVYYREKKDEQVTFWEPIPACYSSSATSTVWSVTEPVHLQFRSAVETPEGGERLDLASYESFADAVIHGFVGHSLGFNATLRLDTDAASGSKSFATSFYFAGEDRSRIEPGMKIGVAFNNKFSKTDWSCHRYLEFAYWAEDGDPMYLWIQSASDELYVPVLDLVQGSKRTGWNQMVVDFNTFLPNREARKEMKMIAFVAPVEHVNLDREYQFKFDDFCLWNSGNMAETSVDPTPPPAVKNLRYHIADGNITWEWDAVEDPESGIAGYAYLWNSNRSQRPRAEVNLMENRITFPFREPNYQTIRNFMVRSCNPSGQWSETVIETLKFNYDD
jgi:hypothetical protein